MEHETALLENASLKHFNTFGIEAKCRFFAEIKTTSQLQNLLTNFRAQNFSMLLLGGGSNILFTQDYPGIIIKNNIGGIEKINEDENHVWLKAGAGENWHQFVLHCIEKNYSGIENLSLIPGNVGAAPIQNIGAYGVEIESCFHELTAINLLNNQKTIFKHSDCQFGYRDSVFKNRFKNHYAICDVTLKLNKKPIFHISYGAIKETLKQMSVTKLSVKAISDAVIHIRRSKLPDPNRIGNAGSFFKNPILNREAFVKLQKRFSNIPHFPQPNNKTKLSAAWLIEQCGWKGKRIGDAGVHDKQALVIVNHGNASGAHIAKLAKDIQDSVEQQFGISLAPEVNII